MKTFAHSLSVLLIIVSTCTSCFHHHSNNIKLTISESEHYYKVYAAYPEENTQHVAYYMNKKIGNDNHVSFVNTTMDAQLVLDDGTNFYIKNEPGELEIRFNKDENTDASYQKIKSLGEGLKPVLHTQ